MRLTIHDHNRDNTGYTYIYPVVSRRAGGVSVGINLNPNNACNWACVYCQVPGLIRGDAPPIDLTLLEKELRTFLDEIINGDWLARHAPETAQSFRDIAFSGNGEPTSAHEFHDIVCLLGRIASELKLPPEIKIRLITNGSLMHRQSVLDGISAMAAINGEVWFKIDRATAAGMVKINGINYHPGKIKQRLLDCASKCPTWVQSCWFNIDGTAPSDLELAAYLELLSEVRANIQGVHLYGLARQSMQPGAERLSAMTAAELQRVADKIRQLGLLVHVNA